MPVFAGTTSSSATSTALAIPSRIKGYVLNNNGGGNITVDVGIFLGSTIIYVLKSHTVAAGTPHEVPVADYDIPAFHQIYISVSGSCAYYFSID